MEAIKPPFSAYDGEQPYLFVSYAHKDSAVVYPDIARLYGQGYRTWYDEGIEPGSEWPEDVANALDGCSLFLLFISPNAVASQNVRNEIHFAVSRKKPILVVHLEKTEMPAGLELQLGSVQAVMRYGDTEEEYWRKMEKAFASHQHLRGETPTVSAVSGTTGSSRRALLVALLAVALVLAAAGWWHFQGRERAINGSGTPVELAASGDTGATADTSRLNKQPSAGEGAKVKSVAAVQPVRAPVRRIPKGAVICATGPGARAVQSALLRALGQRRVRIVPSGAGVCAELVEALTGLGTLPPAIAEAPEAKAYIAIETSVTIEDPTYFMASANGQAVVALLDGRGVRTQDFTFVPGQIGVQPSEAAATRMVVTDFVEQNRVTIDQIADAVRSGQ